VTSTARRGPTRRPIRTGMLLFAFAFAVMADPVSSVAYAIEAALRALAGRLDLLLLTMGIVLGIISLVRINYDQLIRRFPEGGGAVAATGTAFGEGWAFLPLGALIVDFVLTIAISVAAAASATIAYFPSLAAHRTTIAVALCCLVAGLTWFGHFGRSVFATMTVLFAVSAIPIVLLGLFSPHAHGTAPPHAPGTPPPPGARDATPWIVLLAFPVAMALATGVEAPSSAIAQLGQLDDRGRSRFGRITLWLTFAIEGSMTLLLVVLAVKLRVGVPPGDSTLIADIARTAAGRGPWFAFFQVASALLLLAAAASSFQAGPGLLKALARHTHGSGEKVGVLAPALGHSNRHHTPYWSVVVYLAVSALVVMAAGGREQDLVLFYAVSVFVSFLCGLLAMARFSIRDGSRYHTAVNLVGALVVLFTLAVNLRRGYPIASLAASAAVAAVFFRLWVRHGRPRGIAQAEREMEEI